MHSTSHAPTARRLRRLAPLLAIPVSLMMVDTAIAAPKVLVKSSGALTRAVPAVGLLSHPLDIKAKGTITDVDVFLAIDAENNNEHLTIYLRHPSGRIVTLSSTNGGTGGGYGDLDTEGCAGLMRFNDEAELPVESYEPFNQSITGSVQPESKVDGAPKSGLGALDGRGMAGRWELLVADTDNEFSQATLQCVKLRISYKPA